jgi:uncharacterized protein YjbI with pentapeptide repeats
MANPEHLKILKQGVKAWNKWRDQNPHVIPDLREANLREAHLRRVRLDRANLSAADLFRADLFEADLFGVDLLDADVGGANLSGASLCRTNLLEARLWAAKLRAAHLGGATLGGANLHEADLSGADLSGADLREAVIGYTMFCNNDLSEVQGLETVIHIGPSTIGIDTIYKSKGNIPEAFLRGCGVPEDFILYMKSLVGRAIEFYSCFISYSSKDDDFAKRLYADLQAQNVRCWFAPEDLKIGDKFRARIDEAIRVHDKLLLVLSEGSVKSAWVEKEVETAFEKERRQDNKPVLFPIRLDDAVMKTDQAWAADIRRTRHIGDFTHWKDHDAYQQAFQRLLRDLKAEVESSE